MMTLVSPRQQSPAGACRAPASPGDDDPGDLSRRLTAARTALGVDLGELSRRAGIAPGYITYLEHRADATPTAATLARLATALGTSVGALRGGTNHRVAPASAPAGAPAPAPVPAGAPAPAGAERRGRIVVGVDGSDASKNALAWAARQAALTGARLEAVTAWHVPPLAYGTAPADYNFAPDARRAVDETISAVLGEHPDVDVSPVVVEGLPTPALLHAAAGADLLVVGSRGHGALTGVLLGSVSEHCVTHAPCPVVVVGHHASPA